MTERAAKPEVEKFDFSELTNRVSVDDELGLRWFKRVTVPVGYQPTASISHGNRVYRRSREAGTEAAND